MKTNLRRAILFIPVWFCLIVLSLLRDILFAKVKSYRHLQRRNKFDDVCKMLYALVKPRYRFPTPSFLVPGYFLPHNNYHFDRAPIDSEVIAKIQKLRDLPVRECVRLDLSSKSTYQSVD